MAVFIPIQQYIALGHISAYLAGNDTANDNALKGASLYNGLRNLILTVTEAVEWAFSINPNDPTLDATGLYLYALCGRYISQAINILNNQSAVAPVVSGPSNQTVSVGVSATFTISVTSVIPFTIAWYRNGILIPGQTGLTYTLLNPQLSDTGALFSTIVTSAAGPTSSNTGLLTVTAPGLVGYYYYGSDYSVALLAGTDAVPYIGTFPITDGNPLSITFPSEAENTYLVIKYPSSQSIKTSYLNLPLNTGVIPSIAFDHNNITTWRYVFSRTGNVFGLNSANPLVLS